MYGAQTPLTINMIRSSISLFDRLICLFGIFLQGPQVIKIDVLALLVAHPPPLSTVSWFAKTDILVLKN